MSREQCGRSSSPLAYCCLRPSPTLGGESTLTVVLYRNKPYMVDFFYFVKARCSVIEVRLHQGCCVARFMKTGVFPRVIAFLGLLD